jgi:hypothetical protein
MHVFQYVPYLNKILGLLNSNLLKVLGYLDRFLKYLQTHFFNSVSYSVQTFFDFYKLFCIPHAMKCSVFCPLKLRSMAFQLQVLLID